MNTTPPQSEREALIEQIGSLTVGEEPHQIRNFLGFRALEVVADFIIQEKASARLTIAEKCWAEVHPAERGWHRVGDIVEELDQAKAALTHHYPQTP